MTKPIYIISDFSLCHSHGVCYWHGCSHWQCLHNAGNLNGTLHSRLQTPQNQDPLYLRKSKKTDHFSGDLLSPLQLTKVISSSIVALDVTVKNIQRNTCSTVTLSNEFHGYATLEMVEWSNFRFFEVTWRTSYFGEYDVNVTDVFPTALRQNSTYVGIYITWMYLIVMYFIPFIGLAGFNVLIFIQVSVLRRSHKTIFAQNIFVKICHPSALK